MSAKYKLFGVFFAIHFPNKMTSRPQFKKTRFISIFLYIFINIHKYKKEVHSKIYHIYKLESYDITC